MSLDRVVQGAYVSKQQFLEMLTTMATHRPHNWNLCLRKHWRIMDLLCLDTVALEKSNLRSNFNNREIDTREVSRFGGHNSLPRLS